MANESVEVIRSGFELFARDGIEALLPLTHPEIEVFADPSVLNSGSFQGRDGFREWSREWFEAWSEISFEMLDVIEVTESIFVVPARQQATGAGSGIEVQMEIAWLMQIEAGLITKFHLYPDADSATAAARRIAAE